MALGDFCEMLAHQWVTSGGREWFRLLWMNSDGLWATSGNFMYSLLLNTLDYFWLFWITLDYFWIALDYFRSTLVYSGLPLLVSFGFFGLFFIALVFFGFLWVTLD